MAIGERFRGGGTRGIARFLADHQHHDAGFDVRREDEPGSGKLKITCEGCGETVSYRAEDAIGLAAASIGEAPANGGRAGSSIQQEIAPEAPDEVPPYRATARPSPAASKPGPLQRPASERTGGLPGWVPAFLIGALIAGGLGMIAVGLLRSDEDGDPAPTATSEPPAPTQPEPAPAPAPGAGAPRAEDPGGSEPAAGAEEPARVELDRTRVAGAFAIGVPKRWERGATDGGISIAADGGSAEVRIFFESGERPNGELARAAAGFLADEHRGAEVSAPETIRFGGVRASEVRATYPGGEEDAVVLSEKGLAFLVLRRVDRGASEQIEREADAVMESFEPTG